MPTKKTTTTTVSKKAQTPEPVRAPRKARSKAEDAMTGGEVPTAWPCGEKCSEAECTHKGRRLVGVVQSYDPTGGRNERGFLDVKPLDGGPVVRFWLNQNAQNVLKTSMRKSNIGDGAVEGAEIAAEFEDWVRTSRGFYTRTFLIGLHRESEHMEPGESEQEEYQ